MVLCLMGAGFFAMPSPLRFPYKTAFTKDRPSSSTEILDDKPLRTLLTPKPEPMKSVKVDAIGTVVQIEDTISH